MKKESVVLAVVSILLFASCTKKADEVVPYSSVATSEMSGTEGADGGKKCNGGPKGQTPPPPEKIMADLDLDKDSLISTSEAKGRLADDFSKVDSNADGFVSLEELKAGGPAPMPVKGK